MKSFKIDRSQINKYMARSSFKAGLYSSLGSFVFIGAIVIWSIGLTDLLKLIGPLIFLSLLVGGIVFLVIFLKRSIPKATVYSLGTDFVGMKIDKNQLNAFNKFALDRSSRKHGIVQDVTIPFAKINSIAVGKSSMKITSEDYNSWSGAGGIVIPCELENYEELVNELRTISKSHSNISFNKT